MKPKHNQTELGGVLGEKVTLRKVNNRVLVTNRPQRPRQLSDKQEVFQEKFLQAVQFAKGQIAEDASRDMYKTGVTPSKRSAFVVALTDYLEAPKIHEIKCSDYRGNVGDVITIDATDDFKVTRVRVVILGSDGDELERGEAIQYAKKTNIWKYTATVANPSVKGSTISATAFDHPENETTLEAVL